MYDLRIIPFYLQLFFYSALLRFLYRASLPVPKIGCTGKMPRAKMITPENMDLRLNVVGRYCAARYWVIGCILKIVYLFRQIILFAAAAATMIERYFFITLPLFIYLGQHRIIIVVRLRRQIVQSERSCSKSATRCRTKESSRRKGVSR